MERDDSETIAARIEKLYLELKAREREQEQQLEATRAELTAVAATLAPAKPARAAKTPGKPRGPRKALGSGPVPSVGPESGPQQVMTGNNSGRWRNPGSVVTFATREEASEAAAG